MQLHLKEHEDIFGCLRRRGLESGVQLVKRKGWVFIQLQGKSFAFHRKKVTWLESGRFVDGHEYYVNYPQKPVKVDGWEEVIEKLTAWLNQLS